MQGYSVSDVEKFMDWCVTKGQIKRNTGVSRKTAVTKVLGHLDADEKADVRTIDLKSAFDRWQNKEGSSYDSSSLAVYESRLKSAIAEFLSYKKDPKSYKPATQTRSVKSGSGRAKVTSSTTNANGTVDAAETDSPGDDQSQGSTAPPLVFSVPIRPGISAWVRISGLPRDMTAEEARASVALTKAIIEPLVLASAH